MNDMFVDDSLFLVIDPLKHHPSDGQSLVYFTMDQHNSFMTACIIKETKNMKHKAISVTMQLPAHSAYVDWTQLNSAAEVIDYMEKHSLYSIVYGGFHRGRCVVASHVGAQIMSANFKCYLKVDLTCILPTEIANPSHLEELDKVAKKYMEYI